MPPCLSFPASRTEGGFAVWSLARDGTPTVGTVPPPPRSPSALCQPGAGGSEAATKATEKRKEEEAAVRSGGGGGGGEGGGGDRCRQPRRRFAGAQGTPGHPSQPPRCPPRSLKFAGMAKTTSLRCRVLEGKDLPAKDLSGSSDPYCVIKVDNEVVARTATVWKSLNPFWGEEITLLLPRGFHSLTIYVLDEDTIGQDDVIGKVSLSHQQISAEPRGVDSWISLAPVNPDQEVQGEIHLELHVPERGHPRVLRCHLIEARDLAPRDASGTSDPFCRVSCCGHTLETAVVKKTRFPHWDEVLEFELPEGELGEAVLSVELWDWDMVGKNDFLGRVEFFLGTLCPGPTRGWFHLLPLPSTTEDHGGQLGALRLAVRLLEDTVLPSHHYQPLIQLLTEPILCPAQSPEGTALAVLEEVTSGESRQDVATKLVKLFLGQGLAVPLLDYLTTRELARTTDPNTLFRSNSLASKSMEQFMKVVGLPYLHEVLKPVVNRIFEEKKYVELDPGKMELSRGRRSSTSPSVGSSSFASSLPLSSPRSSLGCGSSTRSPAPAAHSCCSPRCWAPSQWSRSGQWSRWTGAPSSTPTSCRWWHRMAPGSSTPSTSSASTGSVLGGVPVPAVPAERPGAVAVAVGAAPGHQRQSRHAAHVPPRHLPRRPLDLLPAAHPCRARLQPYPRRRGAGGVERPWGPRGGSTEPLRAPAGSAGRGSRGQRGGRAPLPGPGRGTRWGQAAGGAARPGHRPRRLHPPRRDPRATPKSPPCPQTPGTPQRPPFSPRGEGQGGQRGHRGDAGPAARHGVYSVTQRCTWHRLCAAPGGSGG
ncbi:rasGAP-activating-like protein 1 isoform X8 [Haemorhous mexicanus]|uniref:rasGAP-activating-like protein 1 isoform X8 n=1 Tax=Haemorhous mexicanus TaxID=30427 RepID=UPI0028BD90FD|nr:rasGAP-activating-like protein 1 isoform X8 [Haemorhous mexicanus]